MENIIGAIILALLAIACFISSFRHFKQKGFLFNNAYLYASKEERTTMDKKPHYIQSGIVLSLIGSIFLLNAVNLIFHTEWLFYIVIAVGVIAVVYAIASSIVIETKTNNKESK